MATRIKTWQIVDGKLAVLFLEQRPELLGPQAPISATVASDSPPATQLEKARDFVGAVLQEMKDVQ